MEAAIKDNLSHPRKLEKLYRENKSEFKRSFEKIYPELADNLVAQTWHARLFEKESPTTFGKRHELIFVLALTLLSWLIAKTPVIADLAAENFYAKNISFIVFPGLCVYFIWKQNLRFQKVYLPYVFFILCAIYINLLPDVEHQDSLILVCIHLPLLLWSLTGYIFAGGEINNYKGRLMFLRYNGDLVVMSSLILLAGGLMTGITIQLFNFIQVNIKNFYLDYIVVWGLSATPVIATFLVKNNPQLVARVSPTIAKVFTPLVLLTLLVYIGAMIFKSKDPYQDRDFLLAFNLLLIGVMALILFSIAERSGQTLQNLSLWLLWLLSLVTIVVNSIALSAILFRINAWGITANRVAVMGSNALILINLLMVSFYLFKSIKQRDHIEKVEQTIAQYLPIYAVWTMVVTFLFPWFFNFN